MKLLNRLSYSTYTYWIYVVLRKLLATDIKRVKRMRAVGAVLKADYLPILVPEVHVLHLPTVAGELVDHRSMKILFVDRIVRVRTVVS